MTTMTTEQSMDFDISPKDGRGRPVTIDGDPVVGSSDDTIAAVSVRKDDSRPNTWIGTVNPINPEGGSVDVSATADADVTDGHLDVVAFGSVEITKDPRSAERVLDITFKDPVDKPV